MLVRALHQTLIQDRRIDEISGMMICPEEVHKIYWDDVASQPLDQKLVKKAKAAEMEEFKKHNVYTKVPIEEAWEAMKKAPIGVRWMDVNKGDKVHPEYRSRLVAKEIKKSVNLDLFATTPPLEAKKLLFSMAVTR